MIPDIDTRTLAMIVAVGLAAHLLLVLLAQRINPLFLLFAAFLVFSPFSAATELPGVVGAKYARVYVTLLIPAVGFLLLRLYRPRPAGVAFLAFMTLYCLAGLWSDRPVDAALYKGNFALVAVGGLMIAYSLSDFHDLRKGLRVTLLAASVFGVLTLINIAVNPSAITHLGRLSVWGMNPNRIGQTAAPMLILCAPVALYDPSKLWRLFAYAVGASLAIIIVYTGSRGAAGMAMIGVFAALVPMVRRPGQLFFLFVLVGATTFVAMSLIEAAAAERFTNVSVANRAEPWTMALSEFQKSPVIGVGWLHSAPIQELVGATNAHSMYMQILAETGALGSLVFLGVLVYLGFRGLRTLRIIQAGGENRETGYFALGIIAAVFAHGFIESGAVMGSTINGMMLTMGIGLIDRIPEMLAEQEQWEAIDAFDELSSGEHFEQGPHGLPAPAT